MQCPTFGLDLKSLISEQKPVFLLLLKLFPRGGEQVVAFQFFYMLDVISKVGDRTAQPTGHLG